MKCCLLDTTGSLHTRTQQLQLAAQDLHKIKPANTPHGERGHEAPLMAEELLAVDGHWEGETQFCSGTGI